ncbi:hypothetical protein A3Q56_02807 [Intoshia linei]|uniref:Nephrocystin 3-like N-terminal domain-containing protein n=1 Tax=Intoshia linei TaxID=1819745 RepID=A0A177B729_9BILA|nr:hypothetical protein A3Q56_02807 [Intoshia linei]
MKNMKSRVLNLKTKEEINQEVLQHLQKRFKQRKRKPRKLYKRHKANDDNNLDSKISSAMKYRMKMEKKFEIQQEIENVYVSPNISVEKMINLKSNILKKRRLTIKNTTTNKISKEKSTIKRYSKIMDFHKCVDALERSEKCIDRFKFIKIKSPTTQNVNVNAFNRNKNFNINSCDEYNVFMSQLYRLVNGFVNFENHPFLFNKIGIFVSSGEKDTIFERRIINILYKELQDYSLNNNVDMEMYDIYFENPPNEEYNREMVEWYIKKSKKSICGINFIVKNLLSNKYGNYQLPRYFLEHEYKKIDNYLESLTRIPQQKKFRSFSICKATETNKKQSNYERRISKLINHCKQIHIASTWQNYKLKFHTNLRNNLKLFYEIDNNNIPKIYKLNKRSKILDKLSNEKEISENVNKLYKKLKNDLANIIQTLIPKRNIISNIHYEIDLMLKQNERKDDYIYWFNRCFNSQPVELKSNDIKIGKYFDNDKDSTTLSSKKIKLREIKSALKSRIQKNQVSNFMVDWSEKDNIFKEDLNQYYLTIFAEKICNLVHHNIIKFKQLKSFKFKFKHFFQDVENHSRFALICNKTYHSMSTSAIDLKNYISTYFEEKNKLNIISLIGKSGYGKTFLFAHIFANNQNIFHDVSVIYRCIEISKKCQNALFLIKSLTLQLKLLNCKRDVQKYEEIYNTQFCYNMRQAQDNFCGAVMSCNQRVIIILDGLNFIKDENSQVYNMQFLFTFNIPSNVLILISIRNTLICGNTYQKFFSSCIYMKLPEYKLCKKYIEYILKSNNRKLSTKQYDVVYGRIYNLTIKSKMKPMILKSIGNLCVIMKHYKKILVEEFKPLLKNIPFNENFSPSIQHLCQDYNDSRISSQTIEDNSNEIVLNCHVLKKQLSTLSSVKYDQNQYDCFEPKKLVLPSSENQVMKNFLSFLEYKCGKYIVHAVLGWLVLSEDGLSSNQIKNMLLNNKSRLKIDNVIFCWYKLQYLLREHLYENQIDNEIVVSIYPSYFVEFLKTFIFEDDKEKINLNYQILLDLFKDEPNTNKPTFWRLNAPKKLSKLDLHYLTRCVMDYDTFNNSDSTINTFLNANKTTKNDLTLMQIPLLKAVIEIPSYLCKMRKFHLYIKHCLFNFNWLLAYFVAFEEVESIILKLIPYTKHENFGIEIGYIIKILEKLVNLSNPWPHQFAIYLYRELEKMINEIDVSMPNLKNMMNDIRIYFSLHNVIMPSLNFQRNNLNRSDSNLYTSSVSCMSFLQDKQFLIIASEDNSIYMWNLLDLTKYIYTFNVYDKLKNNENFSYNLKLKELKYKVIKIVSLNNNLIAMISKKYIIITMIHFSCFNSEDCIEILYIHGPFNDAPLVVSSYNHQYLVSFFQGSLRLITWEISLISLCNGINVNSNDHIGSIINKRYDCKLIFETTDIIDKLSYTFLHDNSILIPEKCHGNQIIFSHLNNNQAHVINYVDGTYIRNIKIEKNCLIKAISQNADYYIIANSVYNRSKIKLVINLYHRKSFLFVKRLYGCENEMCINRIHITDQDTHIVAVITNHNVRQFTEIISFNIKTSEHSHINRYDGDYSDSITYQNDFALSLKNDIKVMFVGLKNKLDRKIRQNDCKMFAMYSIEPFTQNEMYIITKSCDTSNIKIFSLQNLLPLIENKHTLFDIEMKPIMEISKLVEKESIILNLNNKLIILTEKGFKNYYEGQVRKSVFTKILTYNTENKKFENIAKHCDIPIYNFQDYFCLENTIFGFSDKRNSIIAWNIKNGKICGNLRPIFKYKIDQGNENKSEEQSSQIRFKNIAKDVILNISTKTRSVRNKSKVVNKLYINEKNNVIENIAISKDKSILIISYNAHFMCVYDLHLVKNVTTLQCSYTTLHLYIYALTDNGSFLAHSAFDQVEKIPFILVWNTKTGRSIYRLQNQVNLACMSLKIILNEKSHSDSEEKYEPSKNIHSSSDNTKEDEMENVYPISQNIVLQLVFGKQFNTLVVSKFMHSPLNDSSNNKDEFKSTENRHLQFFDNFKSVAIGGKDGQCKIIQKKLRNEAIVFSTNLSIWNLVNLEIITMISLINPIYSPRLILNDTVIIFGQLNEKNPVFIKLCYCNENVFLEASHQLKISSKLYQIKL